MKILIIGASGLLARPVISQLDNAGFKLRLFSRNIDRTMFDKDYEIVRGDVLNRNDLSKAIDGCDAVHISVANVNEGQAASLIVDISAGKRIKLISFVSGCTVSEENRWFEMINNKFLAEQAIINSGIPYMIFRPTWFFESLGLMVRDGKAMVLGKQNKPAHWLAAGDFARMVTTAYIKIEARNKTFFIFGPEKFLMKELLGKYCKVLHPEIRKVSGVPIVMLRFIAFLSANKELKNAASLFAYFEKVSELGDPEETNSLLGKPSITFEQWVHLKTR